ncbi:MAG: hypothetical protein LBC19_06315, partial [Tannerella sp.]|nr:hypothetical protein [Tannerella sp.]
MKDVTQEYFPPDILFRNGGGCKVEISAKYRTSRNTGYAWLASKGTDGWHVIGWGETDTETINFGIAGRNVTYLPLYYENGVQTP